MNIIIIPLSCAAVFCSKVRTIHRNTIGQQTKILNVFQLLEIAFVPLVVESCVDWTALVGL